ncbi:MAG: helix-turn-helix domain-containing protein [Planctomycetota bacterium]
MPRRGPDADPSDPMPAITRGLALLRLLSVNGPSLLEHLAQAGQCPKSSALRALTALERCGAVGRDPLTRRWHARMQLVQAEETPERVRLRTLLAELSHEAGCTAEAWEIRGDRLVLVERTGPDVGETAVRARIGFARDWREAEAVAIVIMAAGYSLPSGTRQVQYRSGRFQAVSRSAVAQHLRSAQAAGAWIDPEPNEFGIRRCAACWKHADGRLLGAIAVAFDKQLSNQGTTDTIGMVAKAAVRA